MTSPRTSRRGLFSWALFDWANSPYTTLIITFVFVTYFERGVVKDPDRATQLWSIAMVVSGVLIALASPLLGAIADVAGRRKPWIAAFTLTCALSAGALWFVRPEPAYAPLALLLVVLSNLGFEFGVVFNSAMLPDLVEEARIGRWSGWAWGLGYLGGLAALLIALFGFVQNDTPWLGVGSADAANVRIVGPLVGAWFLAFVWPLFVFTPDKPATGVTAWAALRGGASQLVGTFRRLRHYKNIALFVVARMLYNDGLTTIFAFGALYASAVHGMDTPAVMKFGVLLNITAGAGAALFGFIDDAIGSRKAILISVAGLILTMIVAVAVTDVTHFWIAGATLGIFVGPAQAASRSLLARLAPAELRTEFFGLFAFTGKAISFVGPTMVGMVTALAGIRAGYASIILLFASGFVLMLWVRDVRE